MNKELKRILSYVLNYLSARGATIPTKGIEDFNYVDSGVIDSFEILSFIMEIQNEFEIKLTPEDLQEERIKTIGGIAGMIIEKLRVSD